MKEAKKKNKLGPGKTQFLMTTTKEILSFYTELAHKEKLSRTKLINRILTDFMEITKETNAHP
jgi:hypothetical protein